MNEFENLTPKVVSLRTQDGAAESENIILFNVDVDSFKGIKKMFQSIWLQPKKSVQAYVT